MKPGPNLKVGAFLFLFAFGISAVALYLGAQLVDRPNDTAAEEEAGGPGGPPGGPVAVRLIAKDLKFDKRTIAASPGASVTITLDNQDAGVPHNVAFYTNNRATQSIAKGELISGPATEDLRFSAPSAAGNYFFRCDAHPDQMTGTFVVK